MNRVSRVCHSESPGPYQTVERVVLVSSHIERKVYMGFLVSPGGDYSNDPVVTKLVDRDARQRKLPISRWRSAFTTANQRAFKIRWCHTCIT